MASPLVDAVVFSPLTLPLVFVEEVVRRKRRVKLEEELQAAEVAKLRHTIQVREQVAQQARLRQQHELAIKRQLESEEAGWMLANAAGSGQSAEATAGYLKAATEKLLHTYGIPPSIVGQANLTVSGQAQAGEMLAARQASDLRKKGFISEDRYQQHLLNIKSREVDRLHDKLAALQKDNAELMTRATEVGYQPNPERDLYYEETLVKQLDRWERQQSFGYLLDQDTFTLTGVSQSLADLRPRMPYPVFQAYITRLMRLVDYDAMKRLQLGQVAAPNRIRPGTGIIGPIAK